MNAAATEVLNTGVPSLNAGLVLAEEEGIPVFPCRPDKRPYTPHGLKDASANIDQIGEWIDQYPDALLAVPTGRASKLLAVDIDPDGESWYSDHAEQLACGRVHKTRRGHHLLYRMPNSDIRNSAGKIAPGVDVRAEGGYIIWWPAHGLETVGDLEDLTEPPRWLLDVLSPKATNTPPKVDISMSESRQGPGNRNSTLTKLAGSMRRAGFSTAAIIDALHKENFQRFEPPLPGAEVNAICEQAEKWERGAVTIPTPCAPIDWETLTGPPPARTWWIQDWLGPWPTFTAGAGGAGKTRLWQMIGTALATGRRYLEEPVEPLKVLMWLCEDSKEEAWRQQAAINAHFGLTMADLKGRLYVVPRQGHDNTLLDLSYGKPAFTPLLEELKEQANDYKADVVVLDNLAQLFGGNENDRHQATYFVNGIAGIVSDRPFCPVMLGHIARSQGSEFSGSAAWENAVRMRWYVGPTLPDQKMGADEEPADPDIVYLARRKANYANKDWRRLRFRNGLLLPDQPEGRRFDQGYRDDAAERVVTTAFPRLIAMGIVPSDKPQAADYLPKQIVAKGFAQNHSKAELASAMNRLMGSGRLRREENAGKDSSRHAKPGLVLR